MEYTKRRSSVKSHRYLAAKKRYPAQRGNPVNSQKAIIFPIPDADLPNARRMIYFKYFSFFSSTPFYCLFHQAQSKVDNSILQNDKKFRSDTAILDLE